MIPYRRPPLTIHCRCLSSQIQSVSSSLSSFDHVKTPSEEDLGVEINPVRCAQYGRTGSLFPSSNRLRLSTTSPAVEVIETKLNQFGLDKLDQVDSLLFPTEENGSPANRSDATFLDRIGGDSAKDIMLPEQGLSEKQCQDMAARIMKFNDPSFITFDGGGFAYNTTMPALLYNRLFTNPEWLGKSISDVQARKLTGTLEALHTYQTFIEQLTTMEVASLGVKDLVTACWLAASAARNLSRQRFSRGERKLILLEKTMETDVLRAVTRRLSADGFQCLTIDIEQGCLPDLTKTAAIFVQSPNKEGQSFDLSTMGARAKAQDCKLILLGDPLALCVHQEPRGVGVNMVIGSGQRLGYPVSLADMAAVFMAGDRPLINCTGALHIEQKNALKPEYSIVQLGHRRKGDCIECGKVFTAPLMPMMINVAFGLYYGLAGLQILASRIFRKTAELAYAARELGYSVQGESTWFRTGEHFGVITIHKRNVRILERFCKEAKTNIKIDQVDDYARLTVDEFFLDDVIENDHIRSPLVAGAHELALFSCSSFPFANRPLHPRDITIESSLKALEGEAQLTQWFSHIDRQDSKMGAECHRRGVSQLLSSTPQKQISFDNAIDLAARCTSGLSSILESANPRAPHDQQLGRLLMSSLLESFLRGVTGLDFVSLHPIQAVFALVDVLRGIKAWQMHNQKSRSRDLCLYVNQEATLTTRSILMSHLHPFPVQPQADIQAFQSFVTEIIHTHPDRLSSIILPFPTSRAGVETFKTLADVAHKCGIFVVAFGGKPTPFLSNGGMRYLSFDAALLDPSDILSTPKAILGEESVFTCGSQKFVPFLPTPLWTSEARSALKNMSLTVPGGEPRPTPPYALLPAPVALQLWVVLMSKGREELRRDSHLATLDVSSIGTIARTRSK